MRKVLCRDTDIIPFEISTCSPVLNVTLRCFCFCLKFHRHYEADSESEEGDFAKQIREQSTRIQKEIELERRLKTRAVQRAANQPTQQTLPAPDFQVQV